MRILVHDYAGHPFQVQLSRVLADKGHAVLHLYCSSVVTPRGNLNNHTHSHSSIHIEPVSVNRTIDKYSYVRRRYQDLIYGRKVFKHISKFEPDVVISANTPLEAQSVILKGCRKRRVPFIYWLQDFLGIGIRKELTRRISFLGTSVGRFYETLEQQLLDQSDSIVTTSPDFHTNIRKITTQAKINVIPNWAPLAEVPQYPKSNSWATSMNLAEKFVFLYSGTLGLKHRPYLVAKLSERFVNYQDVRIVITSEGLGSEWLRQYKKTQGVDNIVLLPFQPFTELPLVLGTADVLLANLSVDAGIFSVPSKVLTYLCSGRPILASMPKENLASRTIEEIGAGFVTEPYADDEFLELASRLYNDIRLRKQMGKKGRKFAENTFNVEKITDRFLEVIENVCK